MKSKILAVVVFIFALSACKFFQHNKISEAPSISSALSYPMLDSAGVYDSTKVANWQPKPEAVEYARKVYLNAIDLYANQGKAEASLPLFLQSLRIAPSAYTYLKYCEAAYQCGQWDIINDAMKRAMTDPDVKPFAEMTAARIYMRAGPYSGLEFLEKALQDYPFDIRKVAEDTAFAEVRDNEEFKLMLTRYNVTDEDRKKKILKMFAANFTKFDLPYSIPLDSLDAQMGKDIDYQYADLIKDLRDGSRTFSRWVDKTYQYAAEVNVSPNYHTFIYRAIYFQDPGDEHFLDSIAPEYYYIATVDSSGKNIDLKMIACVCSGVNFQTASIDTTGMIEVGLLHQEWKYNIVDSGYAHNQVTGRSPVGKKYYKVGPDGKITEADQRTSAE